MLRYPFCDSGTFETLYAQSEVPARHTRFLDETESHDGWIRVRDDLVSRIGSGFLVALLGSRGPGKTQIAQQLILTATGLGRSSRYERAMSIFLRLRATYANQEATEFEVIEGYRTPTLLVIDEFQERSESDFEHRMLNHLIDCRYGDMRDTLIIANQTPERFAKSAGESIVDRLTETGGIITANWPSYRKPATE